MKNPSRTYVRTAKGKVGTTNPHEIALNIRLAHPKTREAWELSSKRQRQEKSKEDSSIAAAGSRMKRSSCMPRAESTFRNGKRSQEDSILLAKRKQRTWAWSKTQNPSCAEEFHDATVWSVGIPNSTKGHNSSDRKEGMLRRTEGQALRKCMSLDTKASRI